MVSVAAFEDVKSCHMAAIFGSSNDHTREWSKTDKTEYFMKHKTGWIIPYRWKQSHGSGESGKTPLEEPSNLPMLQNTDVCFAMAQIIWPHVVRAPLLVRTSLFEQNILNMLWFGALVL